MIALSLKPTTCSWSTISFHSTLYTRPVLDVLIAKVPTLWQAEVRLGLQEAIVNAALHGNELDPRKKVVIEYASYAPIYQWLIKDQGSGFASQKEVQRCLCGGMCETDESGRGTWLLTQIFDHVEWNEQGNQLYLGKYIHHLQAKRPLIC
ncbi:MAG: ATP-binding protein [Cyanobacteriota bacterium]|nr:ATP-binding protein [Cyanobacteriota bacterium]